MKNRRILALLGLVLALGSACGRRGGPAELPPTWIWDQAQPLITPDRASRNLWSGWKDAGGVLEAVSHTPRLILWAKEAPVPVLRVTYTLEGTPVEAVVNNRYRRPFVLEPSPAPREASFEAPLRKGMNFVEFLVDEKVRFRLMAVAAGTEKAAPARHLRRGESVTLFLEAGRGEIEWRGSGALREVVREGSSGHLKERARSLRPRLLSRTVREGLALAEPGTVTVTAEKGAFDIFRFSHTKAEPPASPARPRPAFARPPVIILLTDACQAKHLGVYGYGRPTSPNIDRFAEDAVVFENAYANAAYTRSSVRAILSGQYPERSRTGTLTKLDEGGPPTLPEYLKSKGYRTSIFTSTVIVSPKFGFSAGIDDYFQYHGSTEKTESRKVDLARFGTWLRGPSPVFSYVHFIEPHFPIIAPPPFRDMFAPPGQAAVRERRERAMARLKRPSERKLGFSSEDMAEIVDDYDATIAYADSEIGRALDEVRGAGLYDEALIIVLSDHGEALGEHGAWGHSRNVYEETAHIVFVVKFPASVGLKGRVKTLVQGTDIFPTVMDLLGDAESLPGRSLLDLATDPGDRFVISQTIAEVGQFAARWDRWYYILSLNTGRDHLYDLEKDPLKEAGRADDPVRLYMKARLLDWLKRTDRDTEPSRDVDLKKLTPAEIEALKTLGYIR